MGSENHREYKTKTRFQNQWVTKTIENTKKTKIFQDQWFWFTTIGSEICFCFLCILDGFRYPLDLKSWFSCFCWYSRWFWLPIGSEILVFLFCLVFSMVFAIPYIISAVRFLRFPRGCLTECSLHAHGMSNGMLPGCLAGCQDSMNPAPPQPNTSSPKWQCVLSKLMCRRKSLLGN